MGETHPIDRVIGSFTTEEKAKRAVAKAIPLGGDPGSVAYGDHNDRRKSLVAEQQEEMNGAVPLPALNVVPAPAQKPLLVTVTAGAVIGALLGALAALVPVGSWGLSTRLLTYVLITGFGGTVIGLVIAGGLGAQGPAEASAAADGVIVGIDVPAGEQAGAVAEAMASEGPTRVDVLDSGGAARSVTDNRFLSLGDASRRVADRLDQEHGDWSPALGEPGQPAN